MARTFPRGMAPASRKIQRALSPHVGVLVAFNQEVTDAGKDVAMQIAAMNSGGYAPM